VRNEILVQDKTLSAQTLAVERDCNISPFERPGKSEDKEQVSKDNSKLMPYGSLH